MNWFIVAVVVVFFTVAILTSDYWLDKLFGTHPIHDWDETRQHRRQMDALAPKQVQPDYLYWADEDKRIKDEVDEWTRQRVYDFRPDHRKDEA